MSDASSLKIGEKKRLVSILSNKKLPQTLVSQEAKYIVSDETKHTVTILLDDTAGDEWLKALDGMDHITDFTLLHLIIEFLRASRQESRVCSNLY